MSDPLSGKTGTVKTGAEPADVKQIRNWRITRRAKVSQFGTNTGGEWDITVAGKKQWQGTFELVMDDTTPLPFDEGDLVPAQFNADGTNYYGGSVRIEEIEDEVDTDEGTEIPRTVTFLGHGALTKNGALLNGGD